MKSSAHCSEQKFNPNLIHFTFNVARTIYLGNMVGSILYKLQPVEPDDEEIWMLKSANLKNKLFDIRFPKSCFIPQIGWSAAEQRVACNISIMQQCMYALLDRVSLGHFLSIVGAEAHICYGRTRLPNSW